MTERRIGTANSEHQTGGMMPTFAEFYRAINGRDPFPWQARLAREVATTEQWPAEVGVPTGLGKTACLEIAVWWLASQADRAPAQRTAPTRIWWVVNRRLLVDSTAGHAEAIAGALTDPDAAGLTDGAREVVASVAHRLRSLAADPAAVPLEVIRLRGGIASRTPTDPSRPAVLLCTLPMYGSRLLFRGYGLRLRAVDAAMAGTDSLVLLDEAHLAPHLRALLPALAECTPGVQAILGESRSKTRVTALTATGESPASQRFDLDDEDEVHSIVQQRLDAVKPLELRIESRDNAKCIADATLDLVRKATAPAACVVFANTPKTARETFARLCKVLPEEAAEMLLLTGLTREREAERVRARILDPAHGMAASREAKVGRQRHLIVVATQTLEVGADIDAELLKRFSNRPCTTWGGRGTSAHTDAGGPMRAYSMVLRERALLDSDAGMKAADVAAKYRVSGSWVRLLKQRRRETGEVAPRVQRHGRRGMLEPHRHTLAALIAAHPDRTLAELKDALATPASVPTVWRAVRALGLTVKKNGPPVRTRSA